MARSTSEASATVATAPWRSPGCCIVQRPSGIRQAHQIFIDRPEFFVAHSSDRPPRHLLAEFMAVGIDAGAHGGDEFLEFPSLYKIEIGSERPKLARHA